MSEHRCRECGALWRECPSCFGLFVPAQATQRYCSDRCRWRLAKWRSRKPSGPRTADSLADVSSDPERLTRFPQRIGGA